MSTVPMRKLELHVLKNDTDAVLERLGASRCFQLAKAAKKGATAASPFAETIQKLHDIRDHLGLGVPKAIPDGVKLPGSDEAALVDRICAEVTDLAAQEESITMRREQIKDAMSEAKAFAGLSLPFRDLDHLSFLAVRVGKVPKNELDKLEVALGDRALVVKFGDDGGIVAASSKKGRFALDTELKRANFKAKEFAPDFKGLPPELVPSLEGELEMMERRSAEIEARKAELRATYGGAWESLFASYAVAEAIEEVKGGLESSDQVYRLEGWVPKERVSSLVAELGRCTQGRVAVRVFAPAELESVKSGTEKVPVLLKRRPFVSSFERLVVSYGAPLYGTIDPTPIVAVFFVLLFAIMFGDVGQGLVILVTGIILTKGLIAGLRKYQKFGPIFTGVGAGSMVMGFLVGSVFSNEKVLVPLTRWFSGALFGKPVDRFLSLMPESGAMGKLFAFFGFTLGVGVVINSIGLVINIVNKWKLGKKGEALFGKTGLVGAVFFWWAIGMGVRVVLGGKIAWFDALGLGIPLVCIFLSEPLARKVDGSSGEDDGLFSAIVKGLVEVIESVSYYFSKTLSFLRVGAFALSHTVLSFIVFAMGDVVRLRAPGGIVGEIVIVIIGNAVILVLEGMIVAIQVVRLQYYEFFSKFFTEIGVEFDPFVFEYPKE
jgi:V/A-type H+-transporting ATPase subunit I